MSLLASVTKEAPNLPSRVVFYGPEKTGKTSFGCHAPDPIFLMTTGETGLLSLIESGQVPPTAHFPEDFKHWETLWSAVQELIDVQHSYRTLVLDTGNGAELMLAMSICNESFNGSWSEYNEFGRGVRVAAPIWGKFLNLLDVLRTRRKMSIILLHHAAVKQTSNPTGKDWDQFRPEAIDKMWGQTHKWADVIAFYGNKVVVNRDEKATGEQRFLRCAPSAAIVAGNRYGMSEEITAQPGAANLWKAFATELGKAKRKARQQTPTTTEETTEPNSTTPGSTAPPEGQTNAHPPASTAASPPPAGTSAPAASGAAATTSPGAAFYAQLQARDLVLSAQGLCASGALTARVIEACAKHRCTPDVSTWNAEAIKIGAGAMQTCESQIRQEAAHRAGGQPDDPEALAEWRDRLEAILDAAGTSYLDAMSRHSKQMGWDKDREPYPPTLESLPVVDLQRLCQFVNAGKPKTGPVATAAGGRR